MIETTITEPEKHETLTADSQGRVNLGVEYAQREVELVVVESRERETASGGRQQTIGDAPMTEAERTGMSFVRAFGIGEAFLKDEHTATVGEDGVDPETVAPTDVDWSRGYVRDPKNVAILAPEGGADLGGQYPFRDELTADPAGVSDGTDHDGDVTVFENEDGAGSAIADSMLDNVEQVYGYDPRESLEQVRVHPKEAPTPVLFEAPDGDGFLAVAPRVED